MPKGSEGENAERAWRRAHTDYYQGKGIKAGRGRGMSRMSSSSSASDTVQVKSPDLTKGGAFRGLDITAVSNMGTES